MESTSSPSLDGRLTALEAEIAALKLRNERVEGDKAWETSALRVRLLAGFTFVVTAAVFWLIAAPHPLRNACVPSLAYLLSTWTIPFVKRRFLQRLARAR